MENSLGFVHFVANSDVVARFILLLMTLMSIGSWYLIVTKTVRLLAMQRRGRTFLDHFWQAENLDTLTRLCDGSGSDEPFSHLLKHGFAAVDQCKRSGEAARLISGGAPDEFLIRALKRSIAQSKSRMEQGQTFLATVASSAPFVGLFGTVWGIYHALLAIGITGQGTLDKVAGPVGEALIMTAIGLAVAIPAAVAYNVFTRANRNSVTALNGFADDILNLFATGMGIRGEAATGSASVANQPAIHTLRVQTGP